MATDPRQAEIQAAEKNPNIISSLSGADTGGITPPPEFAQTQQVAQDLSSDLYGSGFVGGGEGQTEAAMQELFKTDQQLEQAYAGASPYPNLPWYVNNPADQTAALSGFAGQMGNVAQKSIGAVDTAERAYQTAVNATVDKLLGFLQLQETRKQTEEDRKWEREKFEREMALREKELGRGTAGERASSELEQQMARDAQNGLTIEDMLLRYGSVADYSTIRQVYDQNSSFGPAQRPEQEYRSIFDKLTSGSTTGGDLVSQIANLPTTGERNQARATKDILDVVENALGKVEGTDTGPISNISGDVQALFGNVTPTKQLEQELGEILRVIRKESTGVAFSPQEVKDLLKEVPSVGQQEAVVKDKLQRLKARMLQKLGNLGLDSDEWEVIEE